METMLTRNHSDSMKPSTYQSSDVCVLRLHAFLLPWIVALWLASAYMSPPHLPRDSDGKSGEIRRFVFRPTPPKTSILVPIQPNRTGSSSVQIHWQMR
ncbi:hypothetical protein K437DRAFT_260308 [Tilletiaria anomala UBC 951]|uniref:Uncharacterized protein n=1 Tax=Tilletiaria anomala (strain ATCC 24038 / CBS 436.72 / UBC 951) TaxID=1037660 RepID=A0A066V249_TILAU|nr:uncharacterized protein K437DRAFT_260308 [Tilletiaria anomala UBC 951]KDN35777.1 hypothetical protein K437DRAFT_260308 [Tilletiaria anomala UBC 951]